VTITEQLRGKVTVLAFNGSFMGEPEASLFQNKKFQLLEANRNRIILDFSETTMINSSGLGSLISALVTVRNKGGDLRLAGLAKTVDDVIKRVNLDKIFKVFETVEQAVSSFEQEQ
jgi:anti-sigma B factor antagonist